MGAYNPEPTLQWLEASGNQSAQLATESRGRGQPFVWGHALMGSMAQDLDGGVLAWRDLTDSVEVIRYDARGHGLSETMGDPEDFRWDNLARAMWQVADHYTNARVVLGGASMGCATSLHAACQRPDRVKGLVLVIPPTAWESRDKMKRNYRVMAGIVKWTRALPFRLLKMVPSPAPDSAFQRRMFSVMAEHLATVRPEGVVGAMRGAALSDLPAKEELKKLTMPVLILAWPDDSTHPLVVAENLAELLPQAQLAVIKNPEDPDHWPQMVGDFITSLNE
ncbi:MAG: alpha/beta hydrolase [Halioglobus sp.]